MTQKLTYPVADCLAVFAHQDGHDIAIHSRNVCAVVARGDATHITTVDGVRHTIVSTFEVVMQRLSGREAV